MSVRSVSRNKGISRSFLNHPIEFRQVIRKRNSHYMVSPQQYASNTPKSRFRESPESESRIQRILRRSPLLQTPLQKSRQLAYLSQQKQRKAVSKLENNQLSALKRTLTSSIKSFKQADTSQAQRMKTIGTDQTPNKQEQKLQLNQINLQQHKPHIKIKQNLAYSLEELNDKLQSLVSRKLKLVIKETNKNNDISSSIINIMKENINQQLATLIDVIKTMKNNNTNGTQLELLNQKIYLIQTLLAEQSTQSELMKKYYYKVTSNKKYGKIGDFNYFKISLSDICKDFALIEKQKKKQNDQPKVQKPKPLFQATSNQQVYKKPNLSDYQSYRYKQKHFAPNLQPIPRSSYKRQFFFMKSSPDQKIVSKDHSPYYPNHKTPITSIYDKDYKSIKTQIINHRELDAYKNKFKVLKVNYMPKNKLDSVNIDRQSYQKDMHASSRIYSPEVLPHRTSENEMKFNKYMFKSQAHRSFKAQELFERSRIKHQQLKEFQYRMKTLFKA